MNLNKEGYTWEVSENGEVVYIPIKKQFAQSWEELGDISGWCVDDIACITSVCTQGSGAVSGYESAFKTEPQAKASIAASTLPRLIWQVITEWKQDKHMVG